MSLIGQIVVFVFIENALLSNAFGVRRFAAISDTVREKLLTSVVIALFTTFSTIFLWGTRSFILIPLGIPMILPMIYIFLLYPFLYFLVRFLGRFKNASFVSIVFSDLGSSCLVAGITISISISGIPFLESVFASIFSAFGYLLSSLLLDSIKRRLELENVPASFKGIPIILLSAGLMSIAFITIDFAFAIRLTR